MEIFEKRALLSGPRGPILVADWLISFQSAYVIDCHFGKQQFRKYLAFYTFHSFL